MIALLGVGALAALLAAIGTALLSLRTIYTLAYIVVMAAGLGLFYLGNDQAMWLAHLAAAAVLTRFAMDVLLRRSGRSALAAAGPRWVMIFLLWGAFGLIVNRAEGPQVLVAIKNAMVVWALVFPVFHLSRDIGFQRHVERLLIATLLAQLPFVAQQAATYVNWDAIVGTFGGRPEGGGASGTLMTFIIAASSVAVAWWSRGRIGPARLSVVLLLTLGIVAAAEIKASFVLLPLMLAIQLRGVIARRPLQALLIAVGMAGALYAIAGIYATYRTAGNVSRSDTVRASAAYVFDTGYYNAATGELSRFGSVAFWIDRADNDLNDRLIGNGLGSTRRESSLNDGETARRFRGVGIDLTAASQLLWDTGLIGLGLFAAILLVTIREALRVARRTASLELRTRANWIAAMCAVGVALLLYDRQLIDGPAAQFLFATLVGMVAGMAAMTPNTGVQRRAGRSFQTVASATSHSNCGTAYGSHAHASKAVNVALSSPSATAINASDSALENSAAVAGRHVDPNSRRVARRTR